MSPRVTRLAGALLTVDLAFAACRAETDSKEPIDWKVSWEATTTHQDNSPLTAEPSYELEMAGSEDQQERWEVAWRGTATTAVIKAAPGHRCFRAVTVENGMRSMPSKAHCATKGSGQ